MDTKSIEEALGFALDPATRAAFFSGFFIALTIGWFAGVFFSKGLYAFARLISSQVRACFLRKDRLREEERQRKNAAAKRRLESCARRKEAERLAAEKARQDAEKARLAKEFSDRSKEFLKRKIELGIQKEDECTVTDRNGVQYCPECFKNMRLVQVVDFRGLKRICPQCGEEVPSADHWNPPYFC
ncbi:MAG: hypothetical protein E7055_01910 [Lentisphaerae bacterium]|nr:hypothetical protein [Lentisphaerota bacterium]